MADRPNPSARISGIRLAHGPPMLNWLSHRMGIWGYAATAAMLTRSVHENALAHMKARLALRKTDSVGRRARCFGRVHVGNGGAMRIGDDFAFGGPLAAVQIASHGGGIIGIANEVTIEYGTSISARSLVSIGNRVRIGPYCVISDAELPLPLDLPNDWAPRGIMIGDDVWLGARVTLMPGVRIGDRAVVAAGSVVATDIDDDALVAGSPATPLEPPTRGSGVRHRPQPARTDTSRARKPSMVRSAGEA